MEAKIKAYKVKLTKAQELELRMRARLSQKQLNGYGLVREYNKFRVQLLKEKLSARGLAYCGVGGHTAPKRDVRLWYFVWTHEVSTGYGNAFATDTTDQWVESACSKHIEHAVCSVTEKGGQLLLNRGGMESLKQSDDYKLFRIEDHVAKEYHIPKYAWQPSDILDVFEKGELKTN
jgi:hypothetical protein